MYCVVSLKSLLDDDSLAPRESERSAADGSPFIVYLSKANYAARGGAICDLTLLRAKTASSIHFYRVRSRTQNEFFSLAQSV